MESTNLYSLIKKICGGNYTPSELTEFIDLTQKIAVSYLKYQETIGKNIRPHKSKGINELDDVAIDCIAGLFMRNEKGEFVLLKRYFDTLLVNEVNNDDDAVLIMLRRLIVKKTKQELSRIFKERDPESAKILRNIRVAIRNSDHFVSHKEMGREFVGLNIENSPPISHFDINSISDKALFNHFLEQYDQNDSVALIMRKLIRIVNKRTNDNNYLPIDMIANIIKDVTYQQFRRQLSINVETTTPFNELQILEINEVSDLIVNQINNKIYKQYLKKDKIDKYKADIYSNAISDLIQDMTHAKECESNYKYLKKYLPDLTQQKYRENERSIFEYLVKITKKSLRKRLKELL